MSEENLTQPNEMPPSMQSLWDKNKVDIFSVFIGGVSSGMGAELLQRIATDTSPSPLAGKIIFGAVTSLATAVSLYVTSSSGSRIKANLSRYADLPTNTPH